MNEVKHPSLPYKILRHGRESLIKIEMERVFLHKPYKILGY